MENIMNYVMNGLHRIWKSIQRSQQRRADYWILHNLTDKELNDMGVSRGEIRHKVYGDITYR